MDQVLRHGFRGIETGLFWLLFVWRVGVFPADNLCIWVAVCVWTKNKKYAGGFNILVCVLLYGFLVEKGCRIGTSICDVVVVVVVAVACFRRLSCWFSRVPCFIVVSLPSEDLAGERDFCSKSPLFVVL